MVLTTLLAVRAVVVPWRWPRATPTAIGVGEVVATTVLTVLLVTSA